MIIKRKSFSGYSETSPLLGSSYINVQLKNGLNNIEDTYDTGLTRVEDLTDYVRDLELAGHKAKEIKGVDRWSKMIKSWTRILKRKKKEN